MERFSQPFPGTPPVEGAISVTQLNHQIKGVLEPHFPSVRVVGEISRPNYHSSGHLYFTLKDEKSAINGAMWRFNVAKLPHKLQEGEKVLVEGSLSLYPPRGEYKIIASAIYPLQTTGDIYRELEILKQELAKLGYFDPHRKKELPKFPQKIAIITSKTSAALQDMLRIARNRWELTEIYIFDTLVQGEGAEKEIARQITRADKMGIFDLIIVGRGGGSREDLWAFNRREVADAIFQANTPIISAVGHEIDHLLSDMVADRRASTPSNSIEIALPDKNEILLGLDTLFDRLKARFLQVVERKERELLHQWQLLENLSPSRKLEEKSREIEELKRQFKEQIGHTLKLKREEVEELKKLFHHSSPNFRLFQTQREIEPLYTQLQTRFSQILEQKSEECRELHREIKEKFAQILHRRGEEIEELKNLFRQTSPRGALLQLQREMEPLQLQFRHRFSQIVDSKEEEVSHLRRELKGKFGEVLKRKSEEVTQLANLYQKIDPFQTRQRVVELVKDGKVVPLSQLQPGDKITLRSVEGEATAQILSVNLHNL